MELGEKVSEETKLSSPFSLPLSVAVQEILSSPTKTKYLNLDGQKSSFVMSISLAFLSAGITTINHLGNRTSCVARIKVDGAGIPREPTITDIGKQESETT